MDRTGEIPDRHTEMVRVGETEFLVELADAGGPRTIGLDRALSFDGVRATIEAIATELTQAWQKVRPAEATVEFGLSLTMRTGRLTGLMVDAGGTGSLRVSMTWKAPGND